jgi:ABC-type arginine transport system permease subunit
VVGTLVVWVRSSECSAPARLSRRSVGTWSASLVGTLVRRSPALVVGMLGSGTLVVGALVSGALAFGALAFGTLVFGTLAFGMLVFGALVFDALDRRRFRGALEALSSVESLTSPLPWCRPKEGSCRSDCQRRRASAADCLVITRIWCSAASPSRQA